MTLDFFKKLFLARTFPHKLVLLLSVFLVVSMTMLSGCVSYTLGKGKRTLPGGYDRIAVPMFVNKTQEVGIEGFFTADLRTEFERSRLAQVTSVNDAQMIIEGTITTLTYAPSIQIQNASGGDTSIQTPAPLQGLPGPGQTGIQPNAGVPYPGGMATPGGVPLQATNPLPSTAVLTEQYNLTLVIQMDARKASDHSIIWSSNFSSQRQYNAPLLATATSAAGINGINTASPLYNQSSRVDTISRLAVDMMQEAHDRITENF